MMRHTIYLTALLGLLACATGMVIITAGDVPQPANECSTGPEYWCQNIKTAKSCRATKHCIQTVWERQTVQEDNDDICTVCKNMVEEAREQLLSNETQEEMKEVFEGSCKLIPIKLVRINCMKMVDDFVPELIEMLASQMNPTMVCTTALLCNNQWVDGLQAEYKGAKISQGDSFPVVEGNCGQCKAFMNHNAKKLKASSHEDVQRVLFGICGQMNSYSDACMATVADYIDKIYSYLEDNLKDESCTPIGFCPGEKNMRVSIQPLSNDKKFEAKLLKNAVSKSLGEDLECDFCQALVNNLRNILISNSTEDEFVTVLRSICKQSGGFAQQCTSIVDMYANVIYQFLVNELDPIQACRLLTLCPVSGFKQGVKVPLSYLRIEPEGRETIMATKLVPAEKISKQDELSNLAPLPIERLMPQALSLGEPKKPGCVLCEYVLHEVVNELNNSTVDEEIENSLKTICHRLPLPIGNECAKMVSQYGDAMLYMLAQELDPSVLCVQLQLCPAEPSIEVELPKKLAKTPVSDPSACALCEFVVTMVDKKMENNHTEEAVKEALENVCKHMPKGVRKDCTNLVDTYYKQIVEMLVAEFTPDEVCVALKMCNPKLFSVASNSVLDADGVVSEDKGISVGEFLAKLKTDKKPVESKTVSTRDTPYCVMCEFAMASLEKRILTNNTEDEIKRAIDFLCAYLPETVADMCVDFVEQYGDEIFKLLTSQIAPKAVCMQLGLCTPADNDPAVKLLGHRFEHQANVNLSIPSKCDICETIVEYIDKLLEDDTIEMSIDHYIEKACVLMPHGARDTCTSMVETYGPYMLSQLGTLMDKTKVCQSLHLCKPPAGLVQLLGGIQCTYGPSYWCLSMQHANACNALDHCQNRVWMKTEP